MYRIDLQKRVGYVKGNYEKTYRMQLKWAKKKAMKYKMNYLEVRHLHKDWGD